MARRWMQKAKASIERRGTKGSFRKWAKAHGYSSGCSPGAIAAGKRSKSSAIRKKANLASAFCKAKKTRKRKTKK